MHKRTILILLLMTTCIAGITGLQLYWNYKNYKDSVAAIERRLQDVRSLSEKQNGSGTVFLAPAVKDPGPHFTAETKWFVLTSVLLTIMIISGYIYFVKAYLSQQRLNELKDNLINNMTHELQTPLTSISITAEALLTLEHDVPTKENYLNIIRYQADKLTGLADQLLKTRQAAKSRYTREECFNITLLIQNIIQNLPQIPANAHEVNLKNSDDIVVKADREDVRLVFTNLIDNAVKYSNGAPKVEISVQSKGNSIAVCIADEGIGIPDQYHEPIFEPFFRIPTGNKHEVRGYGLGLSLVKELLKRNKGSISVGQNSPKGSIFEVRLPAA